MVLDKPLHEISHKRLVKFERQENIFRPSLRRQDTFRFLKIKYFWPTNLSPYVSANFIDYRL